jgi:hypothetical protein
MLLCSLALAGGYGQNHSSVAWQQQCHGINGMDDMPLFSGSPAGERASRLGGYFLILVTESLYCKPEPDLECRRLRHCDSDCHCEPEMLPVPPWAAPRICSLLV